MARKFLGNIYVVLVLRMLLVYGIYTLARLLFYFFNLNLFEDVTFHGLLTMMAGGLRFDTTAIIYTNLLVILLHILPFRFRYDRWYQQIIKYVFYVVNIIAIISNMADSVYYRFTLRRTTTSVFEEFKNEQNGFGLFFRFIWDYWYVTFSVLCLCFGLVMIYKKIKIGQPVIKNRFIYYPVNLLISAAIGGLCVAGMRGGFAHSTRPITLSNASEYIEKPTHRAIVLNTPFSLIRTIGKTTLQKKQYFSDAEIDTVFTPVHHPLMDSCSLNGTLKGRNVVVLLIESFAKEYVGALNRSLPDFKSYTPFIDSLSENAYLFERAFANGRKSIDAMPSALAGIPAFETPFVLSHYSGNTLNSPASLLAGEGYHSAFFHGAPNGSMGFNAFVKQAGYQEYYGKDEYNNNADFDGIWGIWDEPFLSYMADVLNGFTSPFVTVAFTLSSHHPFKVPEKYIGKFPEGPHPVHKCIGYADNALRMFFKKASAMPWYHNTLFIITADHSAGGYLKEYQTPIGNFSIPMIIYAPGSGLVGYDDSTVVQQVDILPTIMGLLGNDKKFVSYGHNMFDPHQEHFAINFSNGAFQITKRDYLLQFANEKTVGLYDFMTDPMLKNNLTDQRPEIQLPLENKLKAIIQQYNAGMIDNQLSISVWN